VGGGYGNAPGGSASPHLATGNFQLSLEGLALQGLRELVGSLLPGQTLQTQGDVARLITRLHDAVDVLSRALIPLRQSYLKFVSSMDLAKSAHFAQASAMLDMARDPAAVAAALLDFREHAPEASKALENALNDLTTHQVAMLDGVMQGVRALLEELSPSAVSEAAEGKRGGLRLGGRQRDVWEEYCERYARVSDESEAFARIFGEEFARAYRSYRRRSG
jgi:predicted component of type VI protein secretion system